VWDGHYYDFAARRIAAGFGYSDDLVVGGHTVWHPWCHYPVGYSAFLAFFYALLGSSHAVAAVVDSLTGAALAVVTWLLAREGLSRWRARAAGLLVALHPGMILYAALVMTEPLAALLTLLAFWLAVRDSKPARGIVVAALVLGVAALVRPQALFCVPFLALLITPKPSVRALGVLVPVCALALLPILPWTARNCRVMDGCALVSTRRFTPPTVAARSPDRSSRTGAGWPMAYARSPTTPCTGSRSPPQSSVTRSIMSPSRSNTSTKRAPTTGRSGAVRSGVR
jgi:hypothetical protein